MYTQCPHCKTLFTITAQQLRSARGTVQCGQCSDTFDAISYLSDGQIPTIEKHGDRTVLRPGKNPANAWELAQEDRIEPAADSDSYADTIVELTDLGQSLETIFSDTKADAQDPIFARSIPDIAPKLDAPKTERPDEVATNVFDDLIPGIAPDTTTPDLGEEHERAALAAIAEREREAVVDDDATVPEDTPPIGVSSRVDYDDDHDTNDDLPYPKVLEDDIESLSARSRLRTRRVLLGVLSIVLLLALGVQYAWFLPQDMVKRYPLTRPWLSKWCEISKCELPEERDPQKVQISSRDVRVHPQYEGALLITAVLVNNATFSQPFPYMRFTLFNVNGQTIASRDFAPADYLAADVDPAQGMSPNAPTQISMDIVAPEEAAVSFEFKFF